MQVRSKLSSFNINPYDLSIISQKDCPTKQDGVDINIDSDTFSPKSIGGAIKKVGEKIGDGVAYVADGAKNLYNKYAKNSDHGDENGRLVAHPDAEWLP